MGLVGSLVVVVVLVGSVVDVDPKLLPVDVEKDEEKLDVEPSLVLVGSLVVVVLVLVGSVVDVDPKLLPVDVEKELEPQEVPVEVDVPAVELEPVGHGLL